MNKLRTEKMSLTTNEEIFLILLGSMVSCTLTCGVHINITSVVVLIMDKTHNSIVQRYNSRQINSIIISPTSSEYEEMLNLYEESEFR